MIKINQQFEYLPLKRHTDQFSGIRYYETPDGGKLPSVTSIISLTSDKSFLIEWRRRIGDKEATRISKEAAGLGTLIHTHLEKWMLGENRPEGNNVIRKLASDMADVIIQCGMKDISEIFGQEAPLYYPGLYSGTTDLIANYRGDMVIVDFKNSIKIKKEEWLDSYFKQLVAYILAHNELFGTDIKKGVIFMVSRNLKFQEFVLEGDKFDKYVGLWLKSLDEFIKKYS